MTCPFPVHNFHSFLILFALSNILIIRAINTKDSTMGFFIRPFIRPFPAHNTDIYSSLLFAVVRLS